MLSPAVTTRLPKMTWSMALGSTFACSSAALAAVSARSVGLRSFSEPPLAPNGVRLPERIRRGVGMPESLPRFVGPDLHNLNFLHVVILATDLLPPKIKPLPSKQ